MLEAHSLRIAVSGTTGVGKTTLAQGLANALDLPFVAEHFDDHINRSNLAEKQPQQFADELMAILAHKTALEDAQSGFVADRSPVDLLHLWGFYRLDLYLPESASRQFFNACLRRISRYDFLVLPPWGSFPPQQVEPERARRVVRTTNQYTQLKHHASTLGYAHITLPKQRIIEPPVRLKDFDARLAWVCSAIQRRLASQSSGQPSPATPSPGQ